MNLLEQPNCIAHHMNATSIWARLLFFVRIERYFLEIVKAEIIMAIPSRKLNFMGYRNSKCIKRSFTTLFCCSAQDRVLSGVPKRFSGGYELLQWESLQCISRMELLGKGRKIGGVKISVHSLLLRFKTNCCEMFLNSRYKIITV